MNPVVKTEWLTALRSDEYRQGNGELRTMQDRYCCLGVLCDVAVKQGIAKWHYQNHTWWIMPADQDFHNMDDRNQKGSGLLPPFIMNWAWLNENDPKIVETHLSVMNDLRYLSFEKIADAISEHL